MLRLHLSYFSLTNELKMSWICPLVGEEGSGKQEQVPWLALPACHYTVMDTQSHPWTLGQA